MAVLGMRVTSSMAANERPKAWRLGIMDEYPDAAPLVNLISRQMGKEKVSDVEFNWFERRFTTRELTVAAGDTPGSATAGDSDTLHVGTGEGYHCVANTILLNTSTFERVRVTADSSDGVHLDIKRGVGASGAVGAWTADQKIQVIGSAFAEGADIGSARSTDATKYYNYTQIFRTPLSISRNLQKTQLRTGDKQKDMQKMCLRDHVVEQEWAFMFGIPSEDTSTTPGYTRTTGGLYNFVTTNTYSASGGLTLSGWNSFLKSIFTNGSEEKLLLCGSSALAALEDMARAYSTQWAEVGKQDSFGMIMRKWITTFGILMIKEEKLLSKSTPFAGWGFVIDPDKLIYRYVDDTEWYPNEQGNSTDGFIGEYKTDCGLEIHEEYCHGILKDCTSFS